MYTEISFHHLKFIEITYTGDKAPYIFVSNSKKGNYSIKSSQ